MRQRQQKQKQSSSLLSSDSTTVIIDNDVNFERKLDVITAGAKPYTKNHLLTKMTRENCSLIIDYILSMQVEISPAQTYRLDVINKLTHFADVNNPKSFKDITRQDVIDFLDKYRKPESVDSLHKWVGTYENYRITLLRFFRWLYAPDTPQKKRPKPACMENIPKINRKETSTYKPTDLWTEEDDALFYKYCPYSRDRCWHAVARDTGCRPHEMLKMKIKDIVAQQLDNGYQIARIQVNGKTGTRNVRLNNSYPRLKDWLTNGHPFPNVPDVPVFCGIGKKNTGRRLTNKAINGMYDRHKKRFHGLLLQDPTVPEEDKRHIKDLLQKPWNPYLRRHTAATEISKALKDPIRIDKYLGWVHNGNTRIKYQHYFNDDGLEGVLTEMDGLVLSSPGAKGRGGKSVLKPKLCPNCDETNKPESKFCVKCKFVLSFDAFNEAIEEKARTAKEAEESKKRLEELEAKQEILQANAASVLNALMATEMGIKSPEVKIITWRSDEGQEGLFEAAAIARAENEAREKKHKQMHHKQK
jgi:integrase/recombinase XerD